MARWRRIVGLGLALGALTTATVAAAPADPAENQRVVIYSSFSGGLSRYVDRRAGVVCWGYSSGYGGGVDCMPCSQALPGTCGAP